MDYITIAGGEIASHSCKHAAMASSEQYISELVDSKAIIEQNVPGYVCRTFLQPGTWTGEAWLDSFSKLDNPIGQALQATYGQSMAYLGSAWRVGSAHYRYGVTNTINVDHQSYPTAASVNAVLDVVAATPGLVFVISCHGVQESTDTQTYHVRADVLKALMDKLAQLRDGNRIRLMSVYDAYQAVLSDSLNRLPDAGFDCSKPLVGNPFSPWTIGAGANIYLNNGVDNSCYAYLPPNGQLAANVFLPPGRYVLKWKQRTESSENVGRELRCYLLSKMAGGEIYSLLGATYTNSGANAWEERTALVQIPDKAAPSQLFFAAYSGAAFGIDDVSLVMTPSNGALAPTGTVIVPNPTGYRVEWRSPDDDGAVSITIRHATRTHPTLPTEGTAITPTPIPIVRGATQTYVNQSTNWSSHNHFYLSVFAGNVDGSHSDPDLAFLKVDKTPPQMTQLSATRESAQVVTANWLASDPESGIYGYEYAVGTTQGGCDVIAWTSTEAASVVLSNIPRHRQSCLSVRALNPYGFRSSSISTMLAPCAGLADIMELPDDTEVTVTGGVSAIFGDCFYLQEPSRTRGVKIIGTANCPLGQEDSVSGMLTTVAGERAIIQN